jgi:hypothetical protein
MPEVLVLLSVLKLLVLAFWLLQLLKAYRRPEHATLEMARCGRSLSVEVRLSIAPCGQ